MSTSPVSLRYCASCARPKLGAEWACPDCGCDIYTAGASGSARPRAARLVELGGPLSSIAVRPGSLVVLWGPPGGGKSTVGLLAFGDSARSRHVNRRSCQVYTSEMSPDLVLAYCRRIGVRVGRVDVAQLDPDTGALLARLPDDDRPVLLDSITATGAELATLAQLQEHARQRGAVVVVIAQSTKAGEIRGDRRLAHACDVLALVEQQADGTQVVGVQKNRFGPLMSIPFALNAAGATAPQWDRYYSIEGRGPAYQIHAWPSSGRYAAPLSRPGELAPALPPPPCAVAAEFSPLYGGFIEPIDIEAREAFARRAGLPFHRLTHAR